MTDQDSNDGGVGRRDWLTGTGALGVGAVASAFTGTAAAHPKPNTITVQALTGEAKYRIVVDGEIAKGDLAGSSDRVEDGVAVGRIGGKGEADDFRFSGTITGFDVLAGTVAVSVNGKRVSDPVGFPERKRDAFPNTITVQAEGEHVDYRFAVTGDVEAGQEADIGEGDEIDGRVVSGNVAGEGADDYRYSGAVKFASTDGPLTVTLELGQGDD